MFNNKIKLLDLSNNVKYINIIDFIDGDSRKIRTKYLSIIQQLDKYKDSRGNFKKSLFV